jgi:hypothetical protein
MANNKLKLKQASAVLQIEPKELQNLVQFGVVKPQLSDGTYYFDTKTLVAAKVAFRLKEYLGTRMSVLSKLMDAFLIFESKHPSEYPQYIIFKCQVTAGEDPIKLGVPVRTLGDEIKKRMRRASVYKDLPPGRKRRGWKKEFLQGLREAAEDMGGISEAEILREVRSYRRERRALEITVAAEG